MEQILYLTAEDPEERGGESRFLSSAVRVFGEVN
jgi:hypothetical protein